MTVQENNTLRDDASDMIIYCFYGRFTGIRKINDIFGKTVHRGMVE
jgi:hypothetical protein